MIELYVIRHGKTIGNNEGIILGHSDSPLLETKIENIKSNINKIKGIHFDILISSDIGRAQKTSEIILNLINPKPEYFISKELREVNYGRLTGIKKSDANRLYPRYHTDAEFDNINGESFYQMSQRISSFLDRLLKENEDKRILIITQAGCIRAIYSYLKNEDMQKNINMKINHDKILKITYFNDKKSKIEII